MEFNFANGQYPLDPNDPPRHRVEAVAKALPLDSATVNRLRLDAPKTLNGDAFDGLHQGQRGALLKLARGQAGDYALVRRDRGGECWIEVACLNVLTTEHHHFSTIVDIMSLVHHNRIELPPPGHGLGRALDEIAIDEAIDLFKGKAELFCIDPASVRVHVHMITDAADVSFDAFVQQWKNEAGLS